MHARPGASFNIQPVAPEDATTAARSEPELGSRKTTRPAAL